MAHPRGACASVDSRRQMTLSCSCNYDKQMLLSLIVAISVVLGNVSARPYRPPTASFTPQSIWGLPSAENCKLYGSSRITPLLMRGGADVDEEDVDEYDEEDEYDSETEEDEEEFVEDETDGVQIEVNVEKYDEPLVVSPLSSLYVSLGVMLLGRRIDLFNPTVVKIARFAFIVYLILLQVFLLYVRIQAKAANDRTPITLKNPLSSVLQAQLGSEEGSNGMMKNLASSFLSSKSTVLEYDLKQARGMQSGLIFNMAFMWLLHFKMQQVQPLLIQSVTGFMNMVYSPLFQVYVLGRNLERPFKHPTLKGMEEVAAEGAGDTVDAALESSAVEEDEEDTEVSESEEEEQEEEEVAAEASVVDESDESEDQESEEEVDTVERVAVEDDEDTETGEEAGDEQEDESAAEREGVDADREDQELDAGDEDESEEG